MNPLMVDVRQIGSGSVRLWTSLEYVIAMQLKLGLVMSVIDRLRSRVDAVFGGPLFRRVGTTAACGAVLADASLRQEYALEYRAAVNAVYAEAALDLDASRAAPDRMRTIAIGSS
jgi:hypothetical protein